MKARALNASDIKDRTSLFSFLTKRIDPFSGFIYSRISKDTQKGIDALTEPSRADNALVDKLVSDLNRLIDTPSFVSDARKVSQIFLEESMERYSVGNDEHKAKQLNRAVLEGAFPKAFGLGKENRAVHVDKSIYTPSYELGPRSSYSIHADPKHLLFVLARYKFCSKLLAGKSQVVEVGCGDAVGAPLVSQTVGELTCVDRLETLIDGNKKRLNKFKNIKFHEMDLSKESLPSSTFDAAFSIDVLEHVPQAYENAFIENICGGLKKDALLIIGTPNIRAEDFESDPGASPHVNLKSHETLRHLLEKYFRNTSIYSMNDEIVHTGFYPMAHYYLGVGYSLK